MKLPLEEMLGFQKESTYGRAGWNYTFPNGYCLSVSKDGEAESLCSGISLDPESTDTPEELERAAAVLAHAQARDIPLVIAADASFGRLGDAIEREVRERIAPFKAMIAHDVPSAFDTPYADQDFLYFVLAPTTALSQHLFHHLDLLAFDAQHSLRQHGPNYRVDSEALYDDVESQTAARLVRPAQLDAITGFVGMLGHNRPARFFGEGDFVKAVVQRNGSSFTYDDAMADKARELTRGIDDDLQRAKAIFAWIRRNIAYGEHGRRQGVRYRGALETFHNREGVCGESAALQVTLERLAGDIAFLAEAGKDHAVAAHLQPSGRLYLIDTTNDEGFGIPHKDVRLLSDEHSLAKYRE